MNGSRRLGAPMLAALFVIACVQLGGASPDSQAKAGPTLREFFQSLVQHYNPSSLPSYSELRRAEDQINGASPQEISAALPAILAALADRDRTVNGYAGSALFRIATRADGAELLRDYVKAIGRHLLASPDAIAQGSEVMILMSIRPSPPPEVRPLFLSFLRREDRNPIAQVDALGYLITQAPEDSGPVAAEFWHRPMDRNTRIAALNTLANTHSADPRIIGLAVSSLDDGDFEVRLAAFQALTRMGPSALQQAGPAMRKVADQYVALLRQNNGDVNRQISALEDLLFYSPDDPRVVEAVIEFYTHPLDWGPRTAVQNALRIPNLKNVRLIDLIIGSLRDPNPQVRSNAAYVLIDMGSYALERAQPTLQRLGEDPAQPPEVRDAAKRALGKMRN
jgi:HEAT repeats